MPAPHRAGVVRRAASGLVEVGIMFPHPRRPSDPRAGHYVLALTPENARHMLEALRAVVEEGEPVGGRTPEGEAYAARAKAREARRAARGTKGAP